MSDSQDFRINGNSSYAETTGAALIKTGFPISPKVTLALPSFLADCAVGTKCKLFVKPAAVIKSTSLDLAVGLHRLHINTKIRSRRSTLAARVGVLVFASVLLVSLLRLFWCSTALHSIDGYWVKGAVGFVQPVVMRVPSLWRKSSEVWFRQFEWQLGSSSTCWSNAHTKC